MQRGGSGPGFAGRIDRDDAQIMDALTPTRLQPQPQTCLTGAGRGQQGAEDTGCVGDFGLRPVDLTAGPDQFGDKPAFGDRTIVGGPG